jgi:thymidylate synthase (FAD)
MKVDLIDFMGNDLTVVNAARVSMDKASTWLSESECPTDPITGGKIPPYERLKEEDKKLIKYLAKHNHWTPFGHPQVTFRIKAPIFVARQLGKHQVGMVWNEVSRRYVDSEPEFFEPDKWRGKADNVKQGSSDKVIRDITINHQPYIDGYNRLLEVGVCPEQARMVLPQSMYTEWYWTGSLASWARVCKLRLDPHTQKETRDIAELIDAEMIKLFPISWKELMNEQTD